MSKYKHSLRKDKSCLNCGAFVDGTYCSKCGQKNKDSRESFSHLVLEFVFDLVHFDSSFWETTRYLLFSPAKLSLEYMAGKRKSYVDPVKLYIFISFIAFFIPAILPTPHSDKKIVIRTSADIPANWEPEIEKYGKIISAAQLDSVHNSRPKDEQITEIEYKTYRELLLQKEAYHSQDSLKINVTNDEDSIQNDTDDTENGSIDQFVDDIAKGFRKVKPREIKGYGKVRSAAHLDSIHYNKEPNERLSYLNYIKYKWAFNMKENVSDQHKQEKVGEFLIHSLPKVLFVYMPIFAFWIWLFNLNRRKYYFDSGIFTLHFFSFTLLLITIYNILACILADWLGYEKLSYLLLLLIGLLVTFYFFRANRLFYAERRWLANLKGIFLFLINNIFIIVLLVLYFLLALSLSY